MRATLTFVCPRATLTCLLMAYYIHGDNGYCIAGTRKELAAKLHDRKHLLNQRHLIRGYSRSTNEFSGEDVTQAVTFR